MFLNSWVYLICIYLCSFSGLSFSLSGTLPSAWKSEGSAGWYKSTKAWKRHYIYYQKVKLNENNCSRFYKTCIIKLDFSYNVILSLIINSRVFYCYTSLIYLFDIYVNKIYEWMNECPMLCKCACVILTRIKNLTTL